MAGSIAWIRDAWGPPSTGRAMLVVGASIIVWWLAENASQIILTAGQVPGHRPAVAAVGVIVVGRLLASIWTGTDVRRTRAETAP